MTGDDGPNGDRDTPLDGFADADREVIEGADVFEGAGGKEDDGKIEWKRRDRATARDSERAN
ncbi:MAG TPA: hypothetical protein VFH03_15705, partial [Actinoplanes sp.]|nr:hypothetical protein [Actinoplanes sp.]